jgi:hypothetical protein
MLAAHVGYPGATLRLPQRAQNLLLGMSFLRPPFPEACLKETEFKAKLKVYEDFIRTLLAEDVGMVCRCRKGFARVHTHRAHFMNITAQCATLSCSAFSCSM